MNMLEIRNQIVHAISTANTEEACESLDQLVEYLDGRFTVDEMKNLNYDTEAEKSKRFNDYLTWASNTVKTWPEWKRNILGKYKEE
jgi:hypothetical protein